MSYKNVFIYLTLLESKLALFKAKEIIMKIKIQSLNNCLQLIKLTNLIVFINDKLKKKNINNIKVHLMSKLKGKDQAIQKLTKKKE